PPEARRDLVGDDVDRRLLLTVGRLPRALLEATGDDDAGALGEALADVLAELAPGGHVEEGDLLLPLVRLAVLPPSVHGDAEAADRLARRGVSELGLSGQVPDDGHGVI